MDKFRLIRYFEKIEHATERIEDINNWYYSEDIEKLDKKSRLAIYKAMQEIIEVSMDIIAMLLKDLGKITKDDYSNIEKMNELNIIDNSLKENLNEANGLRNRLVHEYNKLNNAIALTSIRSLLEPLSNFLEVVKKWIKKLSNTD
ncbi:MAG: DUF86 domain-containing protein [Candidatus Helarchaeota archaeon]